MKTRKFSVIVTLFMFFVILEGCDTGNKEGGPGDRSVAEETQSGKPETIVAERARLRWEARMRKDWKAVYELMTPGYRTTHDYEVFAAQMARTPLVYRKVEVEKVECVDEDRCTVRLRVENEYRGTQAAFQGMVSTSQVQEEWLRVDGQWWFAR